MEINVSNVKLFNADAIINLFPRETNAARLVTGNGTPTSVLSGVFATCTNLGTLRVTYPAIAALNGSTASFSYTVYNGGVHRVLT